MKKISRSLYWLSGDVWFIAKINRRELCSMEIGWPTSVRHVAFEPEGSQKRSRELPTSVLDSLSSEQVMQCQTEEDYVELVWLLPPTDVQFDVCCSSDELPQDANRENSKEKARLYYLEVAENQSLSSEESTLDNNVRTSDSGQMETEIKSSVLALALPAQWPVGKRIDQPEPSRFEGRAY
ncbi:hypothetical protein Bca4012_045539 [Brassica carinata]